MNRIHGTRFAIVPEWVLYEAELSDRAIRLYAVLARHADTHGRACPSRQRLADLMRCSTDSVDRARAELVEAGALRVEARVSEVTDAQTSNDYWLLADPPNVRTGAAPPPQPCRPPLGTTAEAPLRTGAEQKESHSEREPLNEKQLAAAAPPRQERTRSQEFFQAVAETCGIDWQHSLTDAARGRVAKAASQIERTGCDVEEVAARGETYHRIYPEMPLTPSALSSNWPMLTDEHARGRRSSSRSLDAITRLAVS